MTSLALAWRTARRYKARAALAIAGVAIIGALNFDMLLLSKGLLLSFADMINSTGYDVRVVGSTGLPAGRLPLAHATALVADIRRLPEVASAAIVRGESAAAILADGRSIDVELAATSEPAGAGAWTLLRGANLDNDASGIVVSRSLAESFHLEPGSRLRVRVSTGGALSALPAFDYHVVGVGEFRFESGDQFVGATTLDGLQRAHGGAVSDQADTVLVASAPSSGPDGAAAAIMRVRPDVRAFSNDQAIAQFNRNGFAYFRQMSAVLSTTTGAFAFLLVATLLTVSVNQRLGEVAALRALGIARRRIAATLLWESVLLVGIGGGLALPLGLALAQSLDRILRRMPRLPAGLHFFVFEPEALVTHIVLLGLTAVVAALYPVWLAVNLPIAATLRQEAL